jgi:hypothetical protein
MRATAALPTAQIKTITPAPAPRWRAPQRTLESKAQVVQACFVAPLLALMLLDESPLRDFALERFPIR